MSQERAFQHRIMTAPGAVGMSKDDAHRHWRQQHGELARKVDYLQGYVQNRALPHWWDRMPFLVSADIWYVSEEALAQSREGEYYKTVIQPDEKRFIDRNGIWTALVVGTDGFLPGPGARFRVLGFDADTSAVTSKEGWSRIETLQLAEDGTTANRTLLSAWTDDLERAEALAASLPKTAFVAAPAALIAPPEPGWQVTGESWDWA